MTDTMIKKTETLSGAHYEIVRKFNVNDFTVNIRYGVFSPYQGDVAGSIDIWSKDEAMTELIDGIGRETFMNWSNGLNKQLTASQNKDVCRFVKHRAKYAELSFKGIPKTSKVKRQTKINAAIEMVNAWVSDQANVDAVIAETVETINGIVEKWVAGQNYDTEQRLENALKTHKGWVKYADENAFGVKELIEEKNDLDAQILALRKRLDETKRLIRVERGHGFIASLRQCDWEVNDSRLPESHRKIIIDTCLAGEAFKGDTPFGWDDEDGFIEA